MLSAGKSMGTTMVLPTDCVASEAIKRRSRRAKVYGGNGGSPGMNQRQLALWDPAWTNFWNGGRPNKEDSCVGL